MRVTAADLLAVPEGTRTEAGLRHNIRVGIHYLAAWLSGNGCVPLYDLMEDAATAEICRSQVWQWLHYKVTVTMEDGRPEPLTEAVFLNLAAEEYAAIRNEVGDERFIAAPYARRARPVRRLVHRPGVRRVPDAPRVSHARDPLTRREPSCHRQPRNRWAGIKRPYTDADVDRLRGSVKIEHTLARLGAERLWQLLQTEGHIHALGALTGNQAMQQVRAGLQAIYCSGWQVAADANDAGRDVPRPEPLPGPFGADGGPADQQHPAARRPDRARRGEGATATGSRRSWRTRRRGSAGRSTRSS